MFAWYPSLVVASVGAETLNSFVVLTSTPKKVTFEAAARRYGEQTVSFHEVFGMHRNFSGSKLRTV